MYYDIQSQLRRLRSQLALLFEAPGGATSLPSFDLFGPGTLGTVTQTTTANFVGGDYANFILPVGQTLTGANEQPTIIRAQGTITIAGTINNNALISTASLGGLLVGSMVAALGGNGGNGGSNSAETSGANHYTQGESPLQRSTVPQSYPGVGLGFGLATNDAIFAQLANVTVTGQNGQASIGGNAVGTVETNFSKRLRSRAAMALLIIGGTPGASGIGGGTGGMGGNVAAGGTLGIGGGGGAGGGSIILIAPNIVFAATASLSSNGGNGTAGGSGGNGTNSAGGTAGGGGGGGAGGGGQGGSGGLIFAYAGTITNAGATTSATAGTGAAAGTSAGTGGTNGGGSGGAGGNGGAGSAGANGVAGFVSIANII